MLRDNLVGLIEPMPSRAGANPLALCIAKNKPSDDRPPCLENPRPEGAESTLTENAPSPFHAEPRQNMHRGKIVFPTVVAALCILSAAHAVSQSPIPPARAKDHVGERVVVCGQVASTHFAARSRGTPTFINLDKSYPNQIFTIVVWGSDR